MTIKSGFTLIELVVVMAIFGVLAVVASNFLLSSVSTNTRITIENEARQNASLVMQNISNELRRAVSVSFAGETLAIVDPAGKTTTFFVDGGVMKKNNEPISSGRLVFCKSNFVCDQTCVEGFVVSPTGIIKGPVTVTLNVRQKNNTSRQDSCAKISLTQTVTPRNAGN